MPKGETEATVEDIDEPIIESDGAVKLEEKVIYEEISEEEAEMGYRESSGLQREVQRRKTGQGFRERMATSLWFTS